MLQQHMVMAALGNASIVLPLDGLSLTNIYSAIGFALLRTAYAGSALRVRRSSDNTEQDIGFAANTLDTAALNTFVGANSAFITKMYDQSGAGNDWVQATAGNQPRIVNAGVYDGFARFDATDDYLATTNTSAVASAVTTFVLGSLRSTSGTVIIYESGAGAGIPTSGKNLIQHYMGSGSERVDTSQGTSFAEGIYSSGTSSEVRTARADRSQVTNTGQTKLYLNGAQQTPTSTTTTGSLPTGNYTAELWEIGSRAGTLASSLNLRTFIAFMEDRTDLATIATRVSAAG